MDLRHEGRGLSKPINPKFNDLWLNGASDSPTGGFLTFTTLKRASDTLLWTIDATSGDKLIATRDGTYFIACGSGQRNSSQDMVAIYAYTWDYPAGIQIAYTFVTTGSGSNDSVTTSATVTLRAGEYLKVKNESGLWNTAGNVKLSASLVLPL